MLYYLFNLTIACGFLLALWEDYPMLLLMGAVISLLFMVAAANSDLSNPASFQQADMDSDQP